MNQVICINDQSFPAANSEVAKELLYDALQGVLELNTGRDRFQIMADSNTGSFLSLLIAPSFTFYDYLTFLKDSNDIDLYSFLLEVSDKSPAIDNVSVEIIDELFLYSFYIPNQPLIVNADIFAIAYHMSAPTLSIATSDIWKLNNIRISRTEAGEYRDELLYFDNIASKQHGIDLLESRKPKILELIIDKCEISESFKDWLALLNAENHRIVSSKLKLSYDKSFEGGKPLFDTLENADGIREMRCSAFNGGAFRVLFKKLTSGKTALLVGFYKKANNEGYSENIPRAIAIFNSIQNGLTT